MIFPAVLPSWGINDRDKDIIVFVTEVNITAYPCQPPLVFAAYRVNGIGKRNPYEK